METLQRESTQKGKRKIKSKDTNSKTERTVYKTRIFFFMHLAFDLDPILIASYLK